MDGSNVAQTNLPRYSARQPPRFRRSPRGASPPFFPWPGGRASVDGYHPKGSPMRLIPRRLIIALACAPLSVAAMAEARPAPDGFGDLVEKVMPAVVNISTAQRLRDGGDAQGSSLGSGFIIDARGYVVTNEHVIDRADEITVVLADGTEYPARLQAVDHPTDLAVLKIDADRKFPAVSWAKKDDARVGDWVVAIGNPFGLGGSVSAGIISADNRAIGGQYDDYIQTDAAINKGNSGGPLFDLDGGVIGVNTVIYSDTGGSVGVGFAIDAGLARGIVRQLIENGVTERGFLGVTLTDIDDEQRTRLNLASKRGALVTRAREGSPAALAGLRRDDVIVRFAGRKVADQRDLSRAVADTVVGKTVEVVVVRGGERVPLNVTLARRETLTAAAPGGPATRSGGLTLQAATAEVKRAYGLADDTEGVVVVSVDAGDPSGTVLRPGDVIRELGWDAVNEPTDFARRLEELRRGGSSSVQILVERGDRLFYERINP